MRCLKSSEPVDLRALTEILHVWRPYWGRLAFGLFLSVIAIVSVVVLLGCAGGSVAQAALGLAATMSILRIFGASRVFLRYFERLFTHDAMFRALASLRVWFFKRLARSSAAGLGFQQAGDVLSRLVNDIAVLDALYLRIILPLVGAIASLVILLLVTARLGATLSLTVAFLFAVAAFMLPFFVAQKAVRRSTFLSQALSALRVAVLDLATGLREMRAFGGEAFLAARITSAEEQLYRENIAPSV